MSSDPAGVPTPASPEEPIAQRVLRQARTGQLDEDRLLPGQDKRERDPIPRLELVDLRRPRRYLRFGHRADGPRVP